MFDQLVDQLSQDSAYRVGITIQDFGSFGDVSVFDLQPVELTFQERRLDWSIAVAPTDGWPALPVVTPIRVATAVASLLVLMFAHVLYGRAVRARKVVARLNSGIDALSAGFLITDKKNRVIHWNETYPKLMNQGNDLKKGMSLEELLRIGAKRGDYRIGGEGVEAWIAQVMDGHRRPESALEIELGDGRWIRAMSRQTPDGDVVGIRFDITDLKRAQLNAERLSHAKSDFISILSHELRTPLT